MPAKVDISAGTAYTGPFKPVDVNSETPLVLETDDYTVKVVVRIREFHKDGKVVPSTYFDDPKRSKDQFSVQFVVTFKQDVSGDHLLWGNDFDQPIRDILPWGFSAAFKTFKWTIDPSVEGDVYADKPYLYGPVLTSVNYVAKQDSDDLEVPLADNLTPGKDLSAKSRRSIYLDAAERKKFVFAKGSTYDFDFVTPFLSMGDKLAVKLPGFTFDVGKYAGLTSLRYVLKNGDDLVFCLVFKATADAADTESSEPDSKPDSAKPEPEPKADDSKESKNTAETAE